MRSLFLVFVALIGETNSDANCAFQLSAFNGGDCIAVDLPNTAGVSTNFLSCYLERPYLCRAVIVAPATTVGFYCCSNNVDGDAALAEVNYLYDRASVGNAFTTTITPCVNAGDRCIELSHFCRDPSYFEYMRINCMYTCGFCGSLTAPALCRDSASVNCKGQAALCQDPLYFTYMTTNCRLTCNRCGPYWTWYNATTTASPTIIIAPTLCVDIKHDCTRRHCGHHGKEAYGRRVCQRTCNSC
uniref:ShKT domain-containing protein n=1 Tax=Rhabditophanes sp. KR3021 TaxID=114890 RepID=A0AC35TLX1_9BILA